MSGLWKLSTNDLLKGLIVAVVGAVLNIITQMIGGAWDWKQLAVVALTAGISYLAKNLATDEQGKVLGKI